jgi:toxin secretion/phage lysis holin
MGERGLLSNKFERVLNLKLKMLLVSTGSFLSLLLGGWDILLKYLVLFIVLDYVTGMTSSAIQGKLSSRTGFIGIAKKIGILIVVAIAHSLDQLFLDPEANIFNINMPLIRTMVIWGYIVNELVSILENVKGMGVPVSPALEKVLNMIQDRQGNQKKGDE